MLPEIKGDTMRVLISDIGGREDIEYVATSVEDCRCSTDAEVFKLVERRRDTITMGKVIGTPHPDDVDLWTDQASYIAYQSDDRACGPDPMTADERMAARKAEWDSGWSRPVSLLTGDDAPPTSADWELAQQIEMERWNGDFEAGTPDF